MQFTFTRAMLNCLLGMKVYLPRRGIYKHEFSHRERNVIKAQYRLDRVGELS